MDPNTLVVSITLASAGFIAGYLVTTIVYLLKRILDDLDAVRKWGPDDDDELSGPRGRRRERGAQVRTQ